MTPTSPRTGSTLTHALFNHPTTLNSLEILCQFPDYKLPLEVIHVIAMQCLSSGDIKSLMALGRTTVPKFKALQSLVNASVLTQLCPNLRILDAKACTFHVDLTDVNKYNVVESYYKLEPFIEDQAGLTLIFNQEGLTLRKMTQNNWGIKILVFLPKISEALDDVPEKDAGPELITNAPIIETRSKDDVLQEKRVLEVGFHGKPTLIEYLALMIATQKELGICLYAEKPLTYGRAATFFNDTAVVVGATSPGLIRVDGSSCAHTYDGSGGRLKLIRPRILAVQS